MSRTRPIATLLLLTASLCLAVGAWAAVPGWTAGIVAEGTGGALSIIEPIPAPIPSFVASQVEGRTHLFYFSPTCPHCKNVMPEVNGLATAEGARWIGIASSMASVEDLAVFNAEHSPSFPVLRDEDSAFARAVGARSTPIVYVVAPPSTAQDAPPEGQAWVDVLEVYAPFRAGSGAVLEMRSHPTTPFAGWDGYQGDTVCGACHITELQSWVLTPHSIAYRTLFLQDRHEDTACVGCHVTGMGEPGGFELAHPHSAQARVSCEACHGPGGPHDGTPTLASSTCEGCHDAEHSIAFSVAKGLPHIDHFLVNALDPDAARTRLQSLADGTLDRPLLAFPEGPTSGAATCKDCHKAEHKAWSKGPHAQAMATLATAKDGQGHPATGAVSCVTCHSTGMASGPAGLSIEAFRIDESVGCESCHGPGAAHIASPGRDNIIGLGKSCPECIIEAVCTTCHVQEWDPDWDLQTRLRALSH